MNPLKAAFRAVTGRADSPYVHVERGLVEKFGLSHDAIKAARGAHLQRGVDWDLVGGLVAYSEPGYAKICAQLGLTAAPATAASPAASDSPPNTEPPVPDSQKNPEEPVAHGEQRDLVCVRRVANRRSILARTASGAAAWVRVADSINFRPGMVLPARFLERDQWELARKCPRHPGKW